MATEKRIPQRFRELLKQELAGWQRDALITTEQASAIGQRYQLDELTRDSSRTLLLVIYIVGAALIGCGVISFVAFNWDAIPDVIKVIAAIGLMLGCHAAGYRWWKVTGERQRLGHALVLLGTLLFGATIGLLAQVFNLNSNVNNGLLAWAAGALAMAYAVRSGPHAMLALALGYIAWIGYAEHGDRPFAFFGLIVAVLLLPLAYLERMRWLFGATLVGIGSAIVVVAVANDSGAMTVLVLLTVAALCFGWGLWSQRSERSAGFAPIALFLGVATLAGVSYALSFVEFAEELSDHDLWGHEGWPVIATAGPALLAAIAMWVLSAAAALRDRVLRPTTSAMLGAVVAIALVALFGQRHDDLSMVATVALSNLAAVSIAVALIWTGVVALRRSLFWSGVFFAAVLIGSRFLEYETGLLFKSIGFLACGSGLIVGGVRYENYLRRRRQLHA